jgi:dTDP-4-dehydrorhamnose reductase
MSAAIDPDSGPAAAPRPAAAGRLRILVAGGSGQVGWELVRSLAPLAEVVAPLRGEFDLAEPRSLEARIAEIDPGLVVNAAAYTAVDRAETERDVAFAINRDGPAELAACCRRRGIGLVHFSTDYVHPGTGVVPWKEDDAVGPVNAYGQSKLDGEEAIRASGCAALILRTSWVYGPRGGNFLLTMLRLGASTQPLAIVADQWGAPTSARLIAATVAAILARDLPPGARTLPHPGTFNLAAAGSTTWHGFATEIFRLRESLTGAPPPVITETDSSAFRTAARRPLNSRLDLGRIERTFGLVLPDWREALALVMADGDCALSGYLADAQGRDPTSAR